MLSIREAQQELHRSAGYGPRRAGSQSTGDQGDGGRGGGGSPPGAPPAVRGLRQAVLSEWAEPGAWDAACRRQGAHGSRVCPASPGSGPCSPRPSQQTLRKGWVSQRVRRARLRGALCNHGGCRPMGPRGPPRPQTPQRQSRAIVSSSVQVAGLAGCGTSGCHALVPPSDKMG